ncbi:MAG TPA: hypothetical protein VLV86_23540 [Vicinamibacterales bacterium]|nr:hypothetical protein [Vicinamibacterales bacterium]
MRTKAIALGGAVALSAVALSGQSARPSATLDDVVNEIRALRAELQHTSGVNARMQVVTARLAAQEQRIAMLTSERANVTNRLLEATRERTDMEAQIKRFEYIESKHLPEELTRDERDALLDTYKVALAHFGDIEQQLRTRDDQLSAEIATERNRWLEFNGHLDALERALK